MKTEMMEGLKRAHQVTTVMSIGETSTAHLKRSTKIMIEGHLTLSMMNRSQTSLTIMELLRSVNVMTRGMITGIIKMAIRMITAKMATMMMITARMATMMITAGMATMMMITAGMRVTILGMTSMITVMGTGMTTTAVIIMMMDHADQVLLPALPVEAPRQHLLHLCEEFLS